jgi:hypothetical protein
MTPRPKEKNGAIQGRKKKLQFGGVFFSTQNTPSSHHVYHAFHHNFTTKTPHSKHPFSQNTPQKRPRIRAYSRVTTPENFS